MVTVVVVSYSVSAASIGASASTPTLASIPPISQSVIVPVAVSIPIAGTLDSVVISMVLSGMVARIAAAAVVAVAVGLVRHLAPSSASYHAKNRCGRSEEIRSCDTGLDSGHWPGSGRRDTNEAVKTGCYWLGCGV